MNVTSVRSLRCRLLTGIAITAFFPSPSHAQQAPERPQDVESSEPATSKEAASIEEIIVTGTLLRGAAPVGSNLISVGQDAVQSQGATSTNELLATVPQVTNFFNTVPTQTLAGNPNQLQVARPNLRNLLATNASTSATLVLVDGRRLAGVGVNQATLDPDLIPTGAIERVEIVTDGGSSTYGADAVGGVINFITRRRFDGLEINARHGFADNYQSTDANAIAGKDWGSGSFYIAYNFAHNDALFGRDRDFIRALDYSRDPAVPNSIQCDPGNVLLGGVTYPLPSLAAAQGANRCDASDNATFVPRNTRHSALASLSQKLNDSITVDLQAFYGKRDTLSENELRNSVTITSANPYYRPIAANPVGNQTVNFSFAPVLGTDSIKLGSGFQEWGTNAEVKAKLGTNWQLRSLFNYSQSSSYFFIRGQANPGRLSAAGRGTTLATAINPYNLAGTSNQALIADIVDNENVGQAKDQLLDLRAIVDGSLLTLPGGDVRVAVGYEYMQEQFHQRFASDIRVGVLETRPYAAYGRDTHSVFGEILLPIVGTNNAVGGINSLTLSASARYDKYSDFGDTFNPKFGVTYEPADWLTIRGNWSTSFTAPTPVDQLGSLRNNIQVFPIAAAVPSGDSAPAGSNTIALQGARPNLQPQTAETWSIGAELNPPFVEGLRLSANYYHVNFEDILLAPPVQTPSQLFQSYSDVVTIRPTTEQIAAFGAQVPGGAAAVAPFLLPGAPFVYELIDFRTGNFKSLEVSGIDFQATYSRPTGFGSIDANVSGNYQLTRKSKGSVGPTLTELNANNPRLTLQGLLGANLGNLRAQVTWNHTSGFDVVRTTQLIQDRIGAFDTINLFFKYDVPGESALVRDLSLTLNVNNVFDTDPPAFRQTGLNGFATAPNEFTLGRLFMLGASKKF